MSMVQSLKESLLKCADPEASCEGCVQWPSRFPAKCMQTLMRDAAWMIDALSAKARPGWISVEDRLPPTNVPILICREKDPGVPLVEAARYEGKMGGKLPWKVYGTRCAHVDWWMPMPKWNSPVFTFSPFSVIPRVAAPTMHPWADRGMQSFAPFLAAMTAWQWLCCFSGTSYPAGKASPFFTSLMATGSLLRLMISFIFFAMSAFLDRISDMGP